jgi:membrane-bound serine protease (ClpP class)
VDELSFPILVGCLAVGFVLLAIEAFVTPGLGVPGLVGTGLVVVAIVFAFSHHGAAGGLLALGAAVVMIGLMAVVAKIAFGRRIFLSGALARPPTVDEDVAGLIGLRGVALSPLRPSGTARFGDRRVDVVTNSDFVDAGTPVVCVDVRGHRVSVRPEISATGT